MAKMERTDPEFDPTAAARAALGARREGTLSDPKKNPARSVQIWPVMVGLVCATFVATTCEIETLREFTRFGIEVILAFLGVKGIQRAQQQAQGGGNGS